MKLLSVFGARPQFIKLAMIARAVERLNSLQRVPLIEHVLVNTGQHYDYRMSGQIATELDLPDISHNLEIGGLQPGRMVGQMISKASDLMIGEKPDCVLVFGDTDPALSGAMAAVKNSIPTAHVDVSASENHEVLTIPAKLFANKLRKHDPIFFSSLESFLEKKTGNYLC